MSLPISRYIDIISGVGGSNNVAQRQLIGRIFTTNSLVDPASVLQFSNAGDVGTFFGTSSEEYLRAVLYYSYIAPNISAPQNLSFARWCDTDSPASVFGASAAYSLTTLQSVVAGEITFDFGGTPVTISGVDLSAASSLTDVATKLQTAFRLNADPHFTSCTVTYDAVNSRFDFAATPTGVVSASFSITQVGTGITDLALQLGWYAANGAIITSSQTLNAPVDAFTASSAISNNFGSFCFTTAAALTLAQITDVANYNNTLNVMYQYQVNVSPANAVAWSAALITIGGTGLTYELANLAEYPEMLPMAILAATNYTKRNAVVNYEFRQVAGITPSVFDTTTANALEAERINYYGQVQQAGQLVSFYQPGILCGLATSPLPMQVYGSEQWLKDAIASDILSLQLALTQLSASAYGRGQILIVLQDNINKALFNGTISVGKPLTSIQQLYIDTQTGIDKSWVQVQNIGFWVDVAINNHVDPNSGVTVYTADYTLIYSKQDAIRKVNGTHILI